MHLIPQSWPHVHILVGVFPSIGFLLGLGFYIAGLRTGNDVLRRVSLALFALLGLLAIPILVSGLGSEGALAGDARFPAGLIETHEMWGFVALGVLLVTGAAAAFELWKARSAQRPTRDPFFAVLGLSVASLVLTVVAVELGFDINHDELLLEVTIPELSTSQVWSHAHLILNHFPTAGFVFGIAALVTALVADNAAMKKGSLILFVILGTLGVPTYVAGTAAMWALTQPTIPEISKAVINSHRDMALWTLFGLAVTGATAWIELWRARSQGSFSKQSLYLVLGFSVVTLAIMTETGHRGGLINHPEIRSASEILPTNPDTGYCLIFGAAVAVGLRVLGFWKNVSFAAVHRILVLGFLGVIMNVVSGMLMMFGDSYRYVVQDSTFAPKIALIPLGAIAVLYFSASDKLWTVQAGESAPITAKWVAAVVLIAWGGVIVCGRMLPYL
jgi:uncharacterized membrane protein